MVFSSPPHRDRYRSWLDADAITALDRAKREAIRLRVEYLGPEHLLLGLLVEPHPALARVLAALGIRASDLSKRVEASLVTSRPARTRVGHRSAKPQDLPYTTRAMKAVQLAIDEARESGGDLASPVHLLLGVIREGGSRAQRALAGLGVTLEKARAALGVSLPDPTSLRISIDDSSDRLIGDQIVTQIMEAVATGRLQPGDRLPPIRQLADDLGIAPGTVARAYSQLEGSGAVLTDGARGTFVAVPGQGPQSDARRPPIEDLLRPVVVAAFHLGATAEQVRAALDHAMKEIFPDAA
jgi:GntR family transcriptional regulator